MKSRMALVHNVTSFELGMGNFMTNFFYMKYHMMIVASLLHLCSEKVRFCFFAFSVVWL